MFVDKYLRDLTYIHHVIHSPSLRKLVDDIYHDLDQHISPKHSHVALLLSVVASATFVWTLQDDPNLYRSVEDTRQQATSWVTAVLDVLDHSRRTMNGSIEDVQALVIVSFLVCNMEGTSLRYYDLVSTATTIARQLSLHRIDLLSCRPQSDSVRAEVGRRVWWYLAALDWILSRFPGPHEGICTIHPQQMTVNKPRNIPDEDMVEGLPLVGLDIAQPTSMSYFLQRMRLGELCYEASSRSTAENWEITTYEDVMEVDAQFEKFLGDFPPFFNLEDDDNDDGNLGPKDPAITVQTYILVGMVQARRCKLHLPSLWRSSDESRWARSRQICLDAARKIIAAERRLEKETEMPFALSRFRFGGTLYCLFLATIALLLDVCLNKAAAGGGTEDRRRAELAQAFQILEDAKSQTKFATTLSESLQRLVSKYKVSLPAVDQGVQGNSAAIISPPGATPDGLSTGKTGNGVPAPDLSYPELPFFDDVWQTCEGGMQLDELDLESIFADINAYM
ncbi:hypothetical protein AYL99_00672 [Fonsecaea erecta]|uniref:Xylanolytic transcriptional activator regulatory domain-containing protein n=1 Tax=Fonsecaea erecta TaxID=1367422 RepID=A0A178ZXX3_9EURO|nr:hypothetical protein AYL99_00672 [Fonsecaea erecta]OAP64700.1 hypothetical protein AYL99_00672 [Fonsecaea erecta]